MQVTYRKPTLKEARKVFGRNVKVEQCFMAEEFDANGDRTRSIIALDESYIIEEVERWTREPYTPMYIYGSQMAIDIFSANLIK